MGAAGGGLYANTQLSYPGAVDGITIIPPEGASPLLAGEGYDPQWHSTRIEPADDPWAHFPVVQAAMRSPQPQQAAASDPWAQFPLAQPQQAAANDPWAQFPVVQAAGKTFTPVTGQATRAPQQQATGRQGPSSFDPEGTSPENYDASVNEARQGAVRSGLWQGAIADPIHGIGQLESHAVRWATHKLYGDDSPEAKYQDANAAKVDKYLNADEADYQAKRAAQGLQPGDTDWYRVGGAVASPINYMGGVGAGAAAENVPTLLGRILARGAGTGAFMGAAEPVTGSDDYAGSKAGQVGTGAVMGAAFEPVGAAMGRALLGVQDPAKRALLDEGVTLTPGQLLGTVQPGKPLGGFWKSAEDLSASIPFAGPQIKEAQQGATLSLNRAAINRMLGEIGEELPHDMPMGHDAMAHALDLWQQNREQLVAQAEGRVDQPLVRDMFELRRGNNPVSGAPRYLRPEEQTRVNQWLDTLNDLNQRYPAGVPGHELTGFSSALGNEVRGLARDPSHYNRQLGQALGDLDQSVNRMVTRQNPAVAPDLAASDRAYANWARIRDAANSAGSIDGVFSPQGLDAAVRRNAATKNQAATGNALMQDLSGNARAVLQPGVPNSGTQDRHAWGELLAGLAAGAGHLPSRAVLGGAALMGGYSDAGLDAFRRLAAGSPQTRALAAELLRYMPQRPIANWQLTPDGGQPAR